MLKIFFYIKRKSLKSMLQYPLNFLVSVFNVSTLGTLDVLIILIPVSTFKLIGGWNFWQLMFMFSLWKIGHAIHQLFFLAFWFHDNFIRKGDYDIFLIRPIHPIVSVCLYGFPIAAIGEFIPSIVIFAITCSKLQITWNFIAVMMFIIFLLCGAVIEWTVSLIISALGFYFVSTESVRDISNVFMFRVSHFPIHIYNRLIQVIVTFIFPYAFMAYYPSHYFFNIKSYAIFSDFFPYAPPLVAIIMLIISFSFYSFSLKHYHSTGT